MQDVCNECWESGYSAGRKNTVLELSEVVKSELHKRILRNEIIYINDVVSILEEVKRNVLCEETHSSQSIPTAT